MKYLLNDGNYAHLKSIIQTSEHLRDYLEQPKDAAEELKRIAQLHVANFFDVVKEAAVPSYGFRDFARAPIVFCGRIAVMPSSA